eukprot:TRINITY_DN5686_c0_g3_i1.p1 TRINITY_DN5686_c0_g3~~TRINITY_DN5686_c0_g3_i1.p1  ORF type:complete len:151 (+),score=18.61 TRINITY_DN5686_c0_g3_i1:369-821(+)
MQSSLNLNELEDLYQPYKKRTTKATKARELGMGEISETIVTDPTLNDTMLYRQVQKLREVNRLSEEEVLTGIHDVVTEIVSHNVSVKQKLRDYYQNYCSGLQKITPPFLNEGNQEFFDGDGNSTSYHSFSNKFKKFTFGTCFVRKKNSRS